MGTSREHVVGTVVTTVVVKLFEVSSNPENSPKHVYRKNEPPRLRSPRSVPRLLEVTRILLVVTVVSCPGARKPPEVLQSHRGPANFTGRVVSHCRNV